MGQIQVQSIMSLFIEMRSRGQGIASGTAIVGRSPNGRPALLTNYHNVSGRNSITGAVLDPQARIPDELAILHVTSTTNNGIRWDKMFEPLQDDAGAPRWKEHPQFGPRVDAVALPLTDVDEVVLNPYLGPGAQPSAPIRYGPAEVVSVVGFPFGMTGGAAFALWATGFVASEPAVDLDDLPLFLIDCRSRQGQSGSPVIALRSGMVTYENGNSGHRRCSVPIPRLVLGTGEQGVRSWPRVEGVGAARHSCHP